MGSIGRRHSAQDIQYQISIYDGLLWAHRKPKEVEVKDSVYMRVGGVELVEVVPKNFSTRHQQI